jgi:hypothetical protein
MTEEVVATMLSNVHTKKQRESKLINETRYTIDDVDAWKILKFVGSI